MEFGDREHLRWLRAHSRHDQRAEELREAREWTAADREIERELAREADDYAEVHDSR
jgi:hypothetical protein